MSEEEAKQENEEYYIFKFDREKHNKNVNKFYHNNKQKILAKMKAIRDKTKEEKENGTYVEPIKKPRAKKGEADKDVTIKVNKEVFAQRARKCYEKNKEAILEKKRIEYHSNQTYKMAYYQKNMAEIKEKAKQRYQKKKIAKLEDKLEKQKEKTAIEFKKLGITWE